MKHITSIYAQIKACFIALVERSFWCNIGLHNWYHGSYSNPVWGRSERRCMDCPKKQHRVYKPLGWKSY